MSNVNKMKISGKYLFCGLWDGGIKMVDIESCSILNSLSGHNLPIYSLDVQKQIIATGSSDRLLKIWNLEGKLLCSLSGHNKTVTCAQITKDRSRIFSSSKDHLVRLWDIQQTQCVAEFRSHNDSVNCLFWRGDILVSAGSDKKIFLWDIRQPLPIHTLEVHKSEILLMELDERKILSYANDRSLVLWDFANIY